MTPMAEPRRILVVCELWQGSNSYAFARAFRRLGHSVVIESESLHEGFGWNSRPLKIARRLLSPLTRASFNANLCAQARALRPHLLLVCKGGSVTAESIEAVKQTGATAILWWPDVSFFAHGADAPRAIPHYDWIFTTKSFGVRDLRETLGVARASFMPHAYDPETHMPFACDSDDHANYDCDVSFIGTWSTKKQSLLETLVERLPNLSLKIWGNQWEKAGPRLKREIMFKPVLGAEYAKAIRLSSVNLGFLIERQAGASSGDLITSRTFHIPASGGFMLHERTDEARDYFVEDRECAMFGDSEEMVAKIAHYLAHPDERRTIAEAGYRRCQTSDYSIDHRARAILEKAADIRARANSG